MVFWALGLFSINETFSDWSILIGLSDWLKTVGSYPYCSTNAKPVNRNENCWASTVIPTTLIRDFLHEYSDISHDKARFQFYYLIGQPMKERF